MSFFRKNAQQVIDSWICEKHFLSGHPAELNDKDNPDWIPHLNMGFRSDSSSSVEFVRPDIRTEFVKPSVEENVINLVEDDCSLIEIKQEKEDEMEIGEEMITDFDDCNKSSLEVKEFQPCRFCSELFHHSELKSVFLPHNERDLCIYAEYVLGIQVKN